MGMSIGETPLPRALAFYDDHVDDNGDSVAWKPMAWGLQHPHGPVVTMTVSTPPEVTLWPNLEHALEQTGWYVDPVEPRTHLAEQNLMQMLRELLDAHSEQADR